MISKIIKIKKLKKSKIRITNKYAENIFEIKRRLLSPLSCIKKFCFFENIIILNTTVQPLNSLA